jgi:hypothetical protein
MSASMGGGDGAWDGQPSAAVNGKAEKCRRDSRQNQCQLLNGQRGLLVPRPKSGRLRGRGEHSPGDGAAPRPAH